MNNYDYSQPYVTRDEYLEVKGIDLNVELQDDDNQSNKVNRFIHDLTNFVLDHLVMDYGCNELNRQTSNFEDLPEFRRKRFHYGMLDQIEYVLNNGLIQLDSGINRESGTITDFSSVTIGPAALKQFRLGAFCNKQERSAPSGDLSPREYTLAELVLALANKVDKVDGKGLSTNDFTNAYKMLIDSLNVAMDNKVDKVIGKVLSDNNFTNALLEKLNGIQALADRNIIEEIRVNNVPLTVTGKAVNIESALHDDTKEDVANKVTTISSESTDAQYPTAKCVYDNLQTVLEVALGGTKAFSVDPTTTGNEAFQGTGATITVTSFVDVNGDTVNVSDLKKGDLVFTLNGVSTKYADRWLIDPATGAWGLIDADTPNLEGYVTTNTAQTISGDKNFTGTVKVSTLTSNSTMLLGNSNYHINFNGVTFRPVVGNSKDLGGSGLRWRTVYTANLDFSGVLNPNAQGYGFVLPDSTNLAANSEIIDSASAQTIPGVKTFSNGVYFAAETYLKLTGGADWNIQLGHNGYGDFIIAKRNNTAVRPSVDNQINLGISTHRWKDFYLSGNLSDGTNSVSVADISTGLSDVANIKSYLPSGVSSSNKLVTESAITTLKNNTFQDVDTTTYATLADFLLSTGEEGIIYLYPIDTSDLTKGYYQYIWESSAWRAMGTTQIDLSGYATLSGNNTFAGQNTFSQNTTFNTSILANNIQSTTGTGQIAIRSDLRSGGSPHDIGTSSYPFKDGYFLGQVYAENTNNVIKVSEMDDSTHFSEAQIATISSGKLIQVVGELAAANNPILTPCGEYAGLKYGLLLGTDVYGNTNIEQYYINSSRLFTHRSLIAENAAGKLKLMGKTFPTYPSSPSDKQYLTYDTDNNVKYTSPDITAEDYTIE